MVTVKQLKKLAAWLDEAPGTSVDDASQADYQLEQCSEDDEAPRLLFAVGGAGWDCDIVASTDETAMIMYGDDNIGPYAAFTNQAHGRTETYKLRRMYYEKPSNEPRI